MVEQNIKSVAINPCGYCNLDCKYCFYPNKSKRKMSKSTADAVMDWIRENLAVNGNISFFGIEPTLNWKMIRYIVKRLGRKYKYDVTTNGTVLTLDMARDIQLWGMGVLVSWDGQPGTHNPYRSNSYDNTVRGVRYLNSRGVRPGIASTVLPETFWYMKENFIHMTTEVELEFVHFNMVQDWPTAWMFSFVEAEFDRLYRYVLTSATPEGFMQKWLEWRKCGERLPRECGAGRMTLGINYDGRIYPCHRTIHWALSMGDVWAGLIEKPSGLVCNDCKMCTVRFCHVCWVNTPNSSMCKLIHMRERVLEKIYKELPEVGSNAD